MKALDACTKFVVDRGIMVGRGILVDRGIVVDRGLTVDRLLIGALREQLSGSETSLYSSTLRRCSSAGLERWIHNPKVGGSSPPIGISKLERSPRW